MVSHPPASHQHVTRLGVGFSSEVVANLSSRLGFSPAGEYEFISALLCNLVAYMAFSHRLTLMNTDWGFYVYFSEKLKMSFTILFEVDTFRL
jgi:hypothetical protein